MGQRAIIVIDTDMFASITDDPEGFVQHLRHRINNPTDDVSFNPYSLRYAAIQHTTATMLYRVAVGSIQRYYPDEFRYIKGED